MKSGIVSTLGSSHGLALETTLHAYRVRACTGGYLWGGGGGNMERKKKGGFHEQNKITNARATY